MQTERVTFLTTPDHKAALDAFAANSGMSVGRVVREATTRYIATPASRDEEAALAFLAPEIEAAVDDMKMSIQSMRENIARTCAVVDAVLAGERP
ncbi:MULTISPECIES: hypothetical protein [Sphingomonas]|jgi:hypothetical protein|uniref:hypothetical protein n=1 Tax=Sphingomonas TaxID=13687 RepID=UPI0006F28365|nr:MULTISPECIES: hypothetical protein [unclassified Sphingomonas]KQN02000.1 hypothetical protein ASE82_12080 [Sphingomonas sp. Leaf230]RKE47434.1 hypothetical protein C8J39_2489 [Sphingomonas sp. PP-CC-1A-547]TCM07543.1 hypothetical protein C8J41_103452 [Sphingomonas sp. PP-CC-3G-468]